MNKTILVMKHEFWRHFKRRGFLFAVLGLPVMMLAIAGGVILFFTSKADEPVGVIDQAGILLEPAAYAAIEEDSMPFVMFSEETAVHNALMQKEVQAYFILPADYLQSGRVTLYHNGDTFDEIAGETADYVRASLLASGDPLLLERFRDNNLDINFRSLAESSEQKSEFGFILSFVIGFIFLIAIFATSGILLQAIVDEKENRTMEILVTSLKPTELMVGKVLGLVGLGFVGISNRPGERTAVPIDCHWVIGDFGGGCLVCAVLCDGGDFDIGNWDQHHGRCRGPANGEHRQHPIDVPTLLHGAYYRKPQQHLRLDFESDPVFITADNADTHPGVDGSHLAVTVKLADFGGNGRVRPLFGWPPAAIWHAALRQKAHLA